MPRVDTLTIDGDAADWDDRGFGVDVFYPKNQQVLPREDFMPRARIAWDDDGLAVLVTVVDDRAAESPDVQPWNFDSVELFVAAGDALGQQAQVVISPGRAADAEGQVTVKVFDRRVDRSVELESQAAAQVLSDGYRVEARLPWSALGIKPANGVVLGFDLQVNDRDDPPSDGRHEVTWFTTGWAGAGPEFMHRLRLSDDASPSVRVIAGMPVDPSLQAQRVLSIATPDYDGRPVAVHAEGQALGSARYESVGGFAVARLRVDTTTLDFDQSVTLSVESDGQAVASLPLPDPRPAVRQAVKDARLHVHPIFAGSGLPGVTFETPAWIDVLLGAYTISTTYYDAAMNPVTQAELPGRYGAITTITSDRIGPIHRYTTLYRVPDGNESDWDTLDVEGLRLPDGLGLNADVVDEQTAGVQRFVSGELQGRFDHEPIGSVLLSWLHATPVDAGPMFSGQDPWSADQRWWLGLKKKLGHFEHRYHLHFPEGYDDPANVNKTWPVILFLHGSGERGLDAEPEPSNGPVFAAAQEDSLLLPFIVISPQCKPGEWWDSPQVLDLLDEVLPPLRADPDRLYLTGLSMGGHGSWYAAIADPGRFAAVAPICGGGESADAARLTDVPVWAFHGDADTAVLPERSTEMIEAIQAAGGRHASLTIYPGVAHNSWDRTYRNPALYDWFLANRRGQPLVSPTEATLEEAVEDDGR
ncbi:MAG: sugar-binding protein [Planctomycetota bacterium]